MTADFVPNGAENARYREAHDDDDDLGLLW